VAEGEVGRLMPSDLSIWVDLRSGAREVAAGPEPEHPAEGELVFAACSPLPRSGAGKSDAVKVDTHAVRGTIAGVKAA